MASIRNSARALVTFSLVLGTACHKSSDGSGSTAPSTDATPPVVTIRFPITGMMTDAATIHVSGTAIDPSGVSAVHVNGAVATTSDGFANWTAVVPLHKGTNVLETTAFDNIGNGDPFAGSVTVENPGPFLLDVLDVAADPTNNRLLVADTLVNAVLAVDLADGTRDVITGKGVGQGTDLRDPERIALDLLNGRALVLDSISQRVLGVDFASGDRTELSGPAVGSGTALLLPRGLAFDTARHRTLVANGSPSADLVLSVDLLSGNRASFSGPGVGAGPAFVGIADTTMDVAHDRVLVLDSGAESLYGVDAATGDRTILSGSSTGNGPAFLTPLKVAVDGAANRAYVEDSGLAAIVSVDLATGDRTILSDATHGEGAALRDFAGIALDPAAGVAYHAARDEVTAVGLSSGDRTSFSSNTRGVGPAFEFPDEMAFDEPSGRLLVKDLRDGGDRQHLVAVDLVTGARTVLSSSALNPNFFNTHGFALDPAHLSLWGAAPAEGLTRQVLAVYNLSNGHIRVGETLSAPPNQTNDMEIDPTGRLFVLGSNGIRMRRITGGPRLAAISDASHGTGPLFSTTTQREAYDLLRDRLLVTDGGSPVQLLAVDVATGNRTVLSSDSVGIGPAFVAPLGVAVDTVNDRVLVLDGGTLALIAVDPVTGDRSYVTLGGADPDNVLGGKGGTQPPVGTGPLFQAPRDLVIDPARNIAFTSNERLMNGILIVDLVSGDRLLLSR